MIEGEIYSNAETWKSNDWIQKGNNVLEDVIEKLIFKENLSEIQSFLKKSFFDHLKLGVESIQSWELLQLDRDYTGESNSIITLESILPTTIKDDSSEQYIDVVETNQKYISKIMNLALNQAMSYSIKSERSGYSKGNSLLFKYMLYENNNVLSDWVCSNSELRQKIVSGAVFEGLSMFIGTPANSAVYTNLLMRNSADCVNLQYGAKMFENRVLTNLKFGEDFKFDFSNLDDGAIINLNNIFKKISTVEPSINLINLSFPISDCAMELEKRNNV